MLILIVDDHAAYRTEVRQMLQRHGHEIEEAGRALEAIPLVESGRFDWLLVDFSMPENSGIWLLEHVKLPPGTRALLVTAHVSRLIFDRATQAGASACIVKPFEEAELLRHLGNGAHSTNP
jgi:two-component system, chemotaxis family, chemotaxis protein CheY